MTEPLRRAFAAVAIFAALLLGPVGARADQAADAADSQRFIQALADKALVLVNSTTLKDSERAEEFRTLFVAAFDIPDIGRFVLGRHWKAATPAQQQDFLKSFEDFTVLTWSTRFKDYTGVRFQVEGATPADDGFMIVDFEDLPQGRRPAAGGLADASGRRRLAHHRHPDRECQHGADPAPGFRLLDPVERRQCRVAAQDHAREDRRAARRL